MRECPDFAATGACSTKGCRLPHVIRAQHKQKKQPPVVDVVFSNDAAVAPMDTDEFISLTFDESSDEEDGESAVDEPDEDEEDENDELSSMDVVM